MDFLQKLDFLMEKYGLNKLTLSQNSGIPYSTIVGWYKKGYEGLKLTTLRKLSDYFNTVLDYWVSDDVLDPNYWKANGFIVNGDEMGHIQKYRLLDDYGKEMVDSALEIEHKRCSAQAWKEAAMLEAAADSKAPAEPAPGLEPEPDVSEDGRLVDIMAMDPADMTDKQLDMYAKELRRQAIGEKGAEENVRALQDFMWRRKEA